MTAQTYPSTVVARVYKHRGSIKRLFQLRAGGRTFSKFISAGSQLRAGGNEKYHVMGYPVQFRDDVMSDIHTFSPTPIQKIDHIMTQYDSPYNTLSNDILYAYMRPLFHK